MRNVFILLIINYSLLITDCFSQWIVLNSGTAQNLNSIHFINQQTGFAVGSGGTIIKTINGGINWILLDAGSTAELTSVYAVNSSVVFVCGYSGTILKSANGGENWTTLNSGTTTQLLILSFYNDLIGICCGNSGTHLYTTNGGNNWLVGYPIGYLVSFFSAFIVDALNGFCGGVNTIFSPLIAKSVNGGANWSYFSFMVNNNEATIRDIHFFNNQNGVAVSILWNNTGGISLTTNGGNNWFGHQIVNNGLFGLDFPLTLIGYAVGGNGYILKTTDGGYNWQQQISNTTAVLRSVDFLDSIYGYAAGSGGIILKTTNGGIVGLKNISSFVPSEFKLYQNYPNQFNPVTKIKFDISRNYFAKEGTGEFVTLKIYNSLGQEIKTLVNEQLTPGTYEVEWNSINYSSGVYYYKLISADYTETKSMVLLK